MALNTGCNTTKSHSGNGVDTDFPYNFELINDEELHVAFYDDVTGEYNEVTTGWAKSESTPFVVFDTPPDDGQQFIIYRLTSIASIKAVFHPGHPVRSQDLNDNFEQLQFAIEDLRCRSGGSGESGSGRGADGKGWTGGSYNPSTGVVTFTSTDGLGFTTGNLKPTNGLDGKGWSSGAYNPTNGTITFNSNDGLGFTTSDLRGDIGAGWTGASYDSSTGVVTFTSNDGLGFSTGDLRGIGITLKGSFNFVGPPTSAVDSSPAAGDLWLDVAGDGWAYDGSSWTNIGTIVGPKGDDGAGYNNGAYDSSTGKVTFTGTGGNTNVVTDDLRADDGTGFNGGSYNSTTGVVTFTSNDGLGFSTSDLRGTDGTDGTGFTGGSYNSTTGKVTFTSNDGLGFSTSDLRGEGVDGNFSIVQINNHAPLISFNETSYSPFILVQDGGNLSLRQNGTGNGNYAFAILPNSTTTAATEYDFEFRQSRVTMSRGLKVNGEFNDTQGSEIVISGVSPQILFEDTVSGAHDFYIHVNSNKFYVLRDSDGSSGAWDDDGDFPLVLDSANNNADIFGTRIINNGAFSVDSDGIFTGNVGIGETNPTEKLDVNGTIKATKIKFGDGTEQTTASSGGGRDPLHKVTRFNVRQEMDDVPTLTVDNAVALALQWAIANLSTPNVYFPSGSYTIQNGATLPYNTSKTQITIYGDGGRGEGTELIFQNTFNIGHPVNINNIKFTGEVNNTDLTNSNPTLLFRRNPPVNSPNTQPLEDDMDSTITNCVFGNGGSANYANSVDIDYRGRNLEVKGCRFVTGGTTGKAIKLSYFCNTNEAISQDELGWKRIMISDNNFHNFDAGCIELGSSSNTFQTGHYPKLRGLVIANNTLETDGKFLTHSSGSNCRLEGASIAGNTLIAYHDLTLIDIPTAHACTITGNTFNGYAEDGRLINVNIDTAVACTVTGNVFNSGQGTTTGSGALSGNTWTGCVVVGNTWFGASTGRISITTTTNCDIQSTTGASYID